MKGASIYFVIYGILLGLVVLALGAAYLPLHAMQLPVGMGIAIAKALLIAIFFMELRHSPSLTRVASGIGVFWFGILMVLSLSDFLSRNWTEMPSRWPQPVQSPEISTFPR